MGGTLQRLIDAGEIRGARGQVTVVHTDGGVRARRVAVAGLGDSPAADDVRHVAALCARTAAAARADIDRVRRRLPSRSSAELATRCLVEGTLLGDYRFDRYLTAPEAERPGKLASLALIGGDRRQAQRAGVVATSVNRARDLQNTPSNHLGPQQLAERAARSRPSTARSPPPSTTAASSSAGGWARSWRSPPPAARSPR